MDAGYNLEWRIRRWARSLQPFQIARVLSYVPLLITPPVAAILIAFYLRQSARYDIDPAAARGIYTVSIINIVLSLVVLNAIGSHLITFLWSVFGVVRDHAPGSGSPRIMI